MSFYVGQPVVCVNNDWDYHSPGDPVPGQVYSVAETMTLKNGQWLDVEGTDGIDWYEAIHFRAATEADMPSPKPKQSLWTDEQVAALNTSQQRGDLHPFTCPGDDGCQVRTLTATTEGWVCEGCGYTQNWAPGVMFQSPEPE